MHLYHGEWEPPQQLATQKPGPWGPSMGAWRAKAQRGIKMTEKVSSRQEEPN